MSEPTMPEDALTQPGAAGAGLPPRPQAARSRRPLVVVGVTVASLLLGGAFAALGAGRFAGDPRTPGSLASTSTGTVSGGLMPPTEAPTATASWPRDEITAVLDQRSAAAVAGEPKRFLATVSTRPGAQRTQQQVLATNLDRIGFATWTYSVGEPVPHSDAQARRLRATLGADAVVVNTTLTYAIRGFDVEPIVTDRMVTLVQDAGQWRVAAEVDGGKFRLPWDDAALTVTRGDRSLVLSAGSAVSKAQVARLADQAIDDVSALWGTAWDQRVVIIVPKNQDQLGRFLRRDGDQYGSLAAVATSEVSTAGATSSADRVWINPGTWPKVSASGRSIVLRHEITHVATGAAIPSAFPLWLEEGLADYVGYRGSGVKRASIARDLLASARKNGAPKALPVRADFAPASDDLSVAYEGAWWACWYIADEYGTAALFKVYRAALADGSADAADVALRSVLGISEAEFTAEWRRSIANAA